MPKYVYHDVLIDMGPMTKIAKRLSGWELPLFEEQFGERLHIEGEAVVEHDEPDAETVHEHFLKRGADERGFPYVELAYGRGRHAAQAIAKAIKESEAGGKPKKAKPAKEKAVKTEKPEPAKQQGADPDGDPLG